ncbi:hypothetical protein TNCV_1693191 [Trichonephila clavipes]|nr:hypothetical protein TNCV_1693191 [Trichonephila clavipes]
MLFSPTPGLSSRPILPLSSFYFHKPLPYNNLGQITAAHGSSIVTTEFSQPVASFLEKLCPIPTLKATCGNRVRRKNVARELTSAEGLAPTKKRVASRAYKDGVGTKRRATESTSKHKCILHFSCL